MPGRRRPLRPGSRGARPGAGRRRRPRVPAVQPAQPGRPGLVAAGAGHGGRHLPAPRSHPAGRRDPRAAGFARGAPCAVRLARSRDDDPFRHFHVSLQGMEYPGAEMRGGRGRIGRARRAAQRALGRAAGRPDRRARGGRRVHRVAALAGCAARPARREPLAAERAACRAPAGRAVPAAGGELPGLAGLPRARPRRRPRSGVPGPWPGRAQSRPRFRRAGARVRPAEHGYLAGADGRGGAADGRRALTGRSAWQARM